MVVLDRTSDHEGIDLQLIPSSFDKAEGFRQQLMNSTFDLDVCLSST
jgi:hypothetical protein